MARGGNDNDRSGDRSGNDGDKYFIDNVRSMVGDSISSSPVQAPTSAPNPQEVQQPKPDPVQADQPSQPVVVKAAAKPSTTLSVKAQTPTTSATAATPIVPELQQDSSPNTATVVAPVVVTLMLLGMGLFAFMFYRRRKRKQRADMFFGPSQVKRSSSESSLPWKVVDRSQPTLQPRVSPLQQVYERPFSLAQRPSIPPRAAELADVYSEMADSYAQDSEDEETASIYTGQLPVDEESLIDNDQEEVDAVPTLPPKFDVPDDFKGLSLERFSSMSTPGM